MKVLKFGGTSVGSVDSIKSVKRIVESVQEPVIVVVSALGGITDQLLLTSAEAVSGHAAYKERMEHIRQRHFEVIEGVVEPISRDTVREQVAVLLDEIANIYKGIFLIRDMSEKTSDLIVSYGERISSLIISYVIAEAVLFDARELIKTHTQFQRHTCDMELTRSLILDRFGSMPKVSLVPGFISSDAISGNTTNLGRGGSDYTASILASILGATQLEIWTDVDGFMTADPRVIKSAYVIDNLSFVEAMELCNFGAKVIYPPTIYPVFHANIPILIKNTFNPEAPGTYISKSESCKSNKSIKGISSINDTCLITIRGLGMVGVIGVNYRIFKALAKSGISVFLVSQASSENTTSFAVRNADADRAVEVLEQEFAGEIKAGEINRVKAERDLATVAIVGENMKHTPGIAGKLFGTLGRNGINVIACAQGASETNISFVIKADHLRKALNVIHDSFFLSEYQVLNLFLCGTGTVGGSLLDQIKQQQELLIKQNGLRLVVVGIVDVKKALFSRDGIDLSTWSERLEQQGLPTSAELLRDEIVKMNIFNSVFVDCTASGQIAALYKDLLLHNVAVVAANKIAASGDYEHYADLKEISRKRGVKYLFETNVGAGLPIINTMNNLINSGDRITKLEAVLSGTLNYIFNVLSEDVPMSKAIRMAQEARYAEPDPRIDLSGTDVIRKLVILSRESGYRVEQSDVVKNLFIDRRYFDGTLEEFWATIDEVDADFEANRKILAAAGKRWRFVAKLENGHTQVGLQEVDARHPFYDLEGSNNIISITTERYKDYPMVIKGYGAGADVTAAGVFSDIISIANIR